MPHAPIARMGGKKNLKKRLIAMFPKDYDTFVEPFVGAGNIFYSTPKVANEIINDKDKDMYMIHKGLKERSQYVQDNLPRTISRATFVDIRKNGKDDLLSTIYRYKAGFMGKGLSFNTQREGDKIAMDFTQFGERLKDVKILNRDYASVIKHYDSPTTFFYLDPPYEGAGKYKDYPDTSVTPQNVYDTLQGLQGKFMLSYNNSDNIKEIFSKYTITPIKTQYSATTNVDTRTVDEIVITNY